VPLSEYDISSSPSPQLFNIAQDPEETTDLASENPDRTRQMLRDLETWFEQVEADRWSIPEADWFQAVDFGAMLLLLWQGPQKG